MGIMPTKLGILQGSDPRVCAMNTVAVVLEKPERLVLSRLDLSAPGDDDVVVDIEWSGISTGTERLLWSGRMPLLPRHGLPARSRLRIGRQDRRRRTMFGRRDRRARVRAGRALLRRRSRPVRRRGLAARRAGPPRHSRSTRRSASRACCWRSPPPPITPSPARPRPELIVGHGVLGRLVGAACRRRSAATPDRVGTQSEIAARAPKATRSSSDDDDARRDYRSICDVSGDAHAARHADRRLAPRGEIVLAGFYSEPLAFAFPPAFMQEARIRVAAEWQPADLAAVKALIEAGAALARRPHHPSRSGGGRR